MNIPDLDMQAFFEEYASFVFPDRQFLRADHFYREEDRSRLTVFLTEKDGKQLLCDAQAQLLCCYDRITPLFAALPSRICDDVAYLLEQLSGLRSRVPRENYEKARMDLQTLAQPLHPPAPAYLVLQKGLLGVVDPQGLAIVPAKYAQIEPFALTHPGDASLFLCRSSGHPLNAMDVYDIRGNCIFRQISSLLPREETLLTPFDTGVPLRTVKSLWVIHKTVEHPFPEDPDFQLVQDVPRRYTVKKLRQSGTDPLQLAAMQDQPLWRHWPAENPWPEEALAPLADRIGPVIGCHPEAVMRRLGDYRTFRLERTPLSARLANVNRDTPLDQLGFSIRAYHCLARSRLQTVDDLLMLSLEELSRLHRSTDAIVEEITAVYHTLSEALQLP